MYRPIVVAPAATLRAGGRAYRPEYGKRQKRREPPFGWYEAARGRLHTTRRPWLRLPRSAALDAALVAALVATLVALAQTPPAPHQIQTDQHDKHEYDDDLGVHE